MPGPETTHGHGHQAAFNKVPEGLGPVRNFTLLLPLPQAFTRWIPDSSLLGPSYLSLVL